MHFTNPFAFVLVFLSITSIAAPLSQPANFIRSVGNTLDVRQLAVVVGDILSICQLVSKGIEDIISGDHNVESTFTQHTISQLGSQYPGKNLLVYHDQDSIVNLSPDAVHAHYELPLPPTFVGLTQGYEIWVFDSGTFSLAGDGGYENWAVGGCFSRQGNNVVFTQCS